MCVCVCETVCDCVCRCVTVCVCDCVGDCVCVCLVCCVGGGSIRGVGLPPRCVCVVWSCNRN